MKTIKHEFVEFIPDVIEERTLYVSIECCTAIHKCVCGCGNEVVTPLSPTDWRLTFDGKTVSLYPSIGNWSFDCRSHYWIENSQIKHANCWSDKKIKQGRDADKHAKEAFYTNTENQVKTEEPEKISLWKHVLKIIKKNH